MTQSFDEWDKWDLGWKGRKAYEAGAQSKQAEIDELRNMVEELISNTIIGFDDDLENKARDLLKGTTNEQ